MRVFHIDYTTRSHENTATVLADNEARARDLISREPDFEAITALRTEAISPPQIVRNSGWRKGFLR